MLLVDSSLQSLHYTEITMNTSQKVVTTTLERALKMLKACGAEYKVVLPNGTQYGELTQDNTSGHHRRTRGDRPYGALSSHIKPYILQDTQPGDVITIPTDGFTPTHVRGAVTAYLSSRWGAGSYTTAITDKAVEVLRVH
jgi:hypothetical protein